MEDDELQTGFFLELEKAKDGSLVAVASTNSLDRHGEVVDNNGWDLKAYKKNPLILWGHDHSIPAIGMSAKTWIEGTGKKAQLMIKPVFHDVTEHARAIKQLVDMGVLKALSVGFKPIESKDGVTFDKNELLEVSVVNVPANADAMMMAYKGLKESGFKDKTIQGVGIETSLIDKMVEMEKAIEELKVKAAPVNPTKKPIERKISYLKVIARTTDKILADQKKDLPVDKKLIKVIKKATELLTVAEKDKLNG